MTYRGIPSQMGLKIINLLFLGFGVGVGAVAEWKCECLSGRVG